MATTPGTSISTVGSASPTPLDRRADRPGAIMRLVVAVVSMATAVALVSVVSPWTPLSPAHADSQLPSKKAWKRDVAAVMAPAFPYLNERVAQGGKLAIVLDIDNTSLATHYAWPRPVRPTLAFAKRARGLGVAVFFVTGRTDSNAQTLRRILRKAGYRFNDICGRHKGEFPGRGKIRCRKAITAQGYSIIASVGNRPVDFRGGYAERTFRLPNYGLALY